MVELQAAPLPLPQQRLSPGCAEQRVTSATFLEYFFPGHLHSNPLCSLSSPLYMKVNPIDFKGRCNPKPLCREVNPLLRF